VDWKRPLAILIFFAEEGSRQKPQGGRGDGHRLTRKIKHPKERKPLLMREEGQGKKPCPPSARGEKIRETRPGKGKKRRGGKGKGLQPPRVEGGYLPIPPPTKKEGGVFGSGKGGWEPLPLFPPEGKTLPP